MTAAHTAAHSASTRPVRVRVARRGVRRLGMSPQSTKPVSCHDEGCHINHICASSPNTHITLKRHRLGLRLGDRAGSRKTVAALPVTWRLAPEWTVLPACRSSSARFVRSSVQRWTYRRCISPRRQMQHRCDGDDVGGLDEAKAAIRRCPAARLAREDAAGSNRRSVDGVVVRDAVGSSQCSRPRRETLVGDGDSRLYLVGERSAIPALGRVS